MPHATWQPSTHRGRRAPRRGGSSCGVLSAAALALLANAAGAASDATAASYMPIVFQVAMIALLSLFLPLTAVTYYCFRRYRRTSEMNRVLDILNVDATYRRVHVDRRPGYHYLIAVIYASAIAEIGILLLFYADGVGLPEFPQLTLGGHDFPRDGSRMVFAMAFFGGYLWGMQHVFRRYALNDLMPAVYYGLSLRMLLAATLALVIFNAYGALTGTDTQQSVMEVTVWPAIAFLMGMFPQRGLRWLTERTPIFSTAADPSVVPAPLDMVQGISMHDRLRLEELGIDDCYDLAMHDFVPLLLKTPYGARELIDWILQAKLCSYVGAAVGDLRHHGIRTILDLESLTPEQIEALVSETSVTRNSLERARELVVGNTEIKRMCKAGQLLSKYWDPDHAKPAT